MEQQQTQNDNNTPQDHTNSKTGNSNNNMNNNGGGFVCRQSSSRWTPTTDQIRILKELYYTNGMRSPTAEQIQRISARLRQYGKIEGKNVFYWFQNHKARERQKKRFTSDHHHLHNVIIQRSTTANNTNTNNNVIATTQDYHQPAFHHVKYSNLPPVIPCGSSSTASVVGVNGQMGNYAYGYGSGVANLEKAFREQCGSGVGSIGHNFGNWVGSVDQYYSSPNYTLIEKRSEEEDDEDDGDDDDDDDDDDRMANNNSPEIETLPLFPMHGEDLMGCGGGGYYSASWYTSEEPPRCHVTARTSLELTLNSYGHASPNHSL